MHPYIHPDISNLRRRSVIGPCATARELVEQVQALGLCAPDTMTWTVHHERLSRLGCPLYVLPMHPSNPLQTHTHTLTHLYAPPLANPPPPFPPSPGSVPALSQSPSWCTQRACNFSRVHTGSCVLARALSLSFAALNPQRVLHINRSLLPIDRTPLP